MRKPRSAISQSGRGGPGPTTKNKLAIKACLASRAVTFGVSVTLVDKDKLVIDKLNCYRCLAGYNALPLRWIIAPANLFVSGPEP